MYDTQDAIVPRAASSRFDRRDETAVATEIAWRVLEEIDYGLILVSPNGAFQHANHLARVELSRGRFLRLEGGSLASHSSEQVEEIMRGVHSAALGRRQMLTLRNGTDTLAVACIPLSHPFERETASVLLMLARQIGTQNLAVSFFSRTHKLTPAEESVLKALCDGLDVHEIATANGVSEYTVRTQVRSLRDKTGINSMRLLVQRVAALPPVVPMSLAIHTRGAAQQNF
jgi:DNA-binding CsgD family transcriptional regulator